MPSSIPPSHRNRLLDHVRELDRRVGLTFTIADLEMAYARDKRLAEAATETVVLNAAGLLRLLKLSPQRLKPFLLEAPTFFRRSPHSVQTQFTDIAALLTMPWRSYVAKVIKNRRIANATPEAVEHIISSLMATLALKRPSVTAMLRLHTPLLASSPETLTHNARDAMRLLDVEVTSYARMVARMPGLLATPAATLVEKIEVFARLFGKQPKEALALMQKAPQLLAMAPETIDGNIRDGATLLNLSEDLWRDAIQKRPHLIGYRPETLLTTVEAFADLFNILNDDVRDVAIRYPAILALGVDGVRKKVPLILQICRALDFDYVAADTLKRCPLAYTYAPDRLRSRLRLAELGLGPRSIMNLLSLPEHDAQVLLRKARG